MNGKGEKSMRKRILSWVMMFSMVIGLLPAVLVMAADPLAVGATYTDRWPESLTENVTDITLTQAIAPNNALTVGNGQTLIIHGNGAIAGASGGITFITVENGGHLVLDQVEVRDNTVDANGVVYVKDGGLLDLGYNDRRARIAPGISGNTSGGTAKNLVIEDGATIRLNAEVKKSIGISYASALYAPVSLIQGGRYTIQGSDLGTGKIISDSTSYTQVMYNDQIILRNANEETTLLVCELYFQQRRQRK